MYVPHFKLVNQDVNCTATNSCNLCVHALWTRSPEVTSKVCTQCVCVRACCVCANLQTAGRSWVPSRHACCRLIPPATSDSVRSIVALHLPEFLQGPFFRFAFCPPFSTSTIQSRACQPKSESKRGDTAVPSIHVLPNHKILIRHSEKF